MTIIFSTLGPSGTVVVGDEQWTATTDRGDEVREGSEVEVVSVYAGGLLKVSSRSSKPAAEARSRLHEAGTLWARLRRRRRGADR